VDKLRTIRLLCWDAFSHLFCISGIVRGEVLIVVVELKLSLLRWNTKKTIGLATPLQKYNIVRSTIDLCSNLWILAIIIMKNGNHDSTKPETQYLAISKTVNNFRKPEMSLMNRISESVWIKTIVRWNAPYL